MTRLAAVLLLVASVSPAFGWGTEGHQAIGEAAQTRLSDKAHAALAKILLGGESVVLPPGKLAAISVWPDEIRLRKTQGLAAAAWTDGDLKEADAFNTAHPANGSWHFVNLPLGASGYPKSPHGADPLVRFASKNDIVHAINAAIAILESPSSSAQYSKAQAVRWIVHLVGDIHQPLHVTSGYFRTTPAALKHPTIIREPAAAAAPGVLSDRGGNGLLFHPDPSNLHSLWDGCLVQRVDDTPCGGGEKTYTALSRKLEKWAKTPEAAQFASTGNHHGWAAQWATDSLKAAIAAEAYRVTLAGAKVQTTDGGSEVFQARIGSPSRQTYASARVRAARDQLVKAVIRLAELLNAIQWK